MSSSTGNQEQSSEDGHAGEVIHLTVEMIRRDAGWGCKGGEGTRDSGARSVSELGTRTRLAEPESSCEPRKPSTSRTGRGSAPGVRVAPAPLLPNTQPGRCDRPAGAAAPASETTAVDVRRGDARELIRVASAATRASARRHQGSRLNHHSEHQRHRRRLQSAPRRGFRRRAPREKPIGVRPWQ
jgi:hypothetical protein